MAIKVLGTTVIDDSRNLTNIGTVAVSGNVVLGNSTVAVGVQANGSYGTAGQILHSNGTATYWATDDQGVTSVASGNGLTGGTITSTGTLSVVAGTGTIVNATGVHVNSTYIGTLSANNTTYVNGKTEGNLNVNAASQLTTARTIGDVSFNGTTNIVPSRIIYKDTRSTDHAPFAYPGVSIHLKTNTTDGLADGGTYHGVLDLAQWVDTSGGFQHQLGTTVNGNIWSRYSTNSTAWSSWSQLVTTTSGTALTANNSTNLGGVAAANYARTDTADDFAGVVTFNANAVLTKALSANGGFGSAGEVLTSAGAGNVYWSAAAGGVNTAAQYAWTNTHSFSSTITLRGYTGGTAGSLVSGYNKTLVIGGAYNQTFNAGNSVLLHIADYDNDTGSNVYPVYIEDENNLVDFFLYAGNNGIESTKIAYLGGKLGVGNTTPASKLHVYSGSGTGVISQVVNNTWAYLANTNANNSSGIWMTSSGSGQLALRDTNANLVAITASGGSAVVSGNVSADSMFASNWFRSTGTTGWYSETYGGGIYMNDTTQVKTYNNKRFWAGAFAGTTAQSTDTSQLQLQNGGGTGDNDVAAISFHCAGYYGMKLHLRADGYFGWGGWSASAWRFYQYLGNGDVTAAGNITAYSDIRLKENITPLENSLDKIKKLNGVRFTWKDLPDIVGAPGKADFGILAHEVEAVAPELISQSPHESPDGDRYKTVAYDKLVPILIEAVKDLSGQVEYLKEELKKLKGE